MKASIRAMNGNGRARHVHMHPNACPSRIQRLKQYKRCTRDCVLVNAVEIDRIEGVRPEIDEAISRAVEQGGECLTKTDLPVSLVGPVTVVRDATSERMMVLTMMILGISKRT